MCDTVMLKIMLQLWLVGGASPMVKPRLNAILSNKNQKVVGALARHRHNILQNYYTGIAEVRMLGMHVTLVREL